jgi:hypothetical protein
MAEQVVRNEKLKLVKFGTTDMMVSEVHPPHTCVPNLDTSARAEEP